MTTPYYPEANGAAERVNQTVMRGLEKLTHKTNRPWTDELSFMIWAYNSKVHRATGKSPYELMFGTVPHNDKQVRELAELLEDAPNPEVTAAEARDHHERHRHREKARFDAKHRGKEAIDAGDWALVRDVRLDARTSKKFRARWHGPTWHDRTAGRCQRE